MIEERCIVVDGFQLMDFDTSWSTVSTRAVHITCEEFQSFFSVNLLTMREYQNTTYELLHGIVPFGHITICNQFLYTHLRKDPNLIKLTGSIWTSANSNNSRGVKNIPAI